MPAPVIPIDARRRGECVTLQLALPGEPLHNIGVMLLDHDRDRLHLRLTSRWEDIRGEKDMELLLALDEDLQAKAIEMGGRRFLESLEDSLSNLLLLGDRHAVAVDAFSRTVDKLYEQQVGPLEVLPYRTHLPLYSLRAAAGRFGGDQQVEEEDWVRAPEDLRLNEGMFVAHVVGRSMEPRIPDGSLNVFRAPVVGSRQNKIVLVELLGETEESARYTVKGYTSVKTWGGGEEWRHASIRLEPLNPEFPSLELADGEFRTIAEWLRTLD